MTRDDLKRRILYHQHLTDPVDKLTACRDLNGFQAQFLSNAFHALQSRCGESLDVDSWGAGLVKSWTVRGTVHVFAEEDLPLFLHENRTNFLRPIDRMETDEYITKERKQYFADYILELVGSGVDTRDELRTKCFEKGMTEREAESVFNSWGGTIRYLAEAGKICYKVQEKKAFQFCPVFEPMERETAEREMARRYFAHFGPATVKDAAYYFGATQKCVKQWMKELPLAEIECEGEIYYEIERVGWSAVTENSPDDISDIPDCILLAGFDQLMLGYEKKTNIFLPPEHLRGIFNLAGIVMPVVLLRGRVVGSWKREKNSVNVSLFEKLPEKDEKAVREAAERACIRRV